MTALPRQDQLFDSPSSDAANDDTTAPVKKPAQRESDGVVAIYLAATGQKYKYQGAKDADAWKRMRSVASVAEIEARWRVGLLAKGWQHTATLAQLDMKWNDLGSLLVKADSETPTVPCAGCSSLSTTLWLYRMWLCLKCAAVADAAAAKVPGLEPCPTTVTDPRLNDWQRARDEAASTALRSKT